MLRRLSLVLLLALGACAQAPSSSAPDAGASGTPDAGSEPAILAATSYCEHIEEGFCSFYLRCGRIAASGMDDCRRIFRETCETKYEPRYVDLEKAGLLTLSSAGVRTCLDSLSAVACEKQPYDLAGACAGMWIGTQPVGSRCGFDIESLTCAPGASCRIDTSLCGVCVPLAQDGEGCGAEHQNAACPLDSECVQGVCRPRADAGEACDGGRHCRLGLTCTQGACQGPVYVQVGQPCDMAHRCPYRSACAGGVCAASSMLGESCAESACASGRCSSANVCEPPLAAGAACTASAACLSGLCLEGHCEPLPSRCIVQ